MPRGETKKGASWEEAKRTKEGGQERERIGRKRGKKKRDRVRYEKKKETKKRTREGGARERGKEGKSSHPQKRRRWAGDGTHDASRGVESEGRRGWEEVVGERHENGGSQFDGPIGSGPSLDLVSFSTPYFFICCLF